MTESPEPQPAIADLTALIPTVVPNDKADPELVTIGERYWALAGFAEDYGTPVWCEKVKDIDTVGWGGQVHAVAAAGVRAVVAGRKCRKCAAPLSLTSRTAFQQVCDGNAPACVECTPSLLDAVRVVLDPARKAKRDAARAKRQAQQARDEAHTRWLQLQQEAVAKKYAAVFPSENSTPPIAGVREQIAALALLRYAPSTSPIDRISAWPDPLHPDNSKISATLGALVRAGLVRIDPSSPVSAFVWEPESFDDALRAAEGDLDALPEPQLTDSFYPLAARYYAPFGTSPGRAAEELDAHLTAALDPAGMTIGRQNDLLAVTRELIADEALRYLTNRLEDLHLPAVPKNHSARLSEAVYKLAELRPLGEIYSLVWRATRAAAEAAQKNPRAPRAHMSTHAVNLLESHAQRAISEPDWEIKPFGEIQGRGPAAMTRTLFYNILGSAPTETSRPQILATLPAPIPVSAPDAVPKEPSPPDDSEDELALTINWLYTCPDSWNPEDVHRALSTVQELQRKSPNWEFEGKVLARGAARLQRLYERLAPILGSGDAALAVFAATEMLIHPVTDAHGESLTSGEWLFHRLGAVLLGLPTGDDSADVSPPSRAD
ncbi:hypothetical protein [Streptomyces sp. NRRL F-5053]|uniref:hypothetical protein n=1 Tax=Streptomyces sp. NRRL F-5053 TaxID=1463854 RepID=UPI0004C7CA2F|nr:hypothetical protein [Streptomyces sp. NRRL F-5053]